MKKKKKLGRRLIKLLELFEGFLLAFDDYFRHPGRAIFAYPAKRRQIYASLSWYQKKGVVEKRIDQNGEWWLSLAGQRFNIWRLLLQPWDGRWRLVVFDVPEGKRGARHFLRRKLKEAGFVCFQRSVWLSPLPLEKEIESWIKSIGAKPLAFVFVGSLARVKDPKKFVARYWRIDAYRRQLEQFEEKLKKAKKLSPSLKTEFFDLLLTHPLLPLELLPANWPIKRIVRHFARLAESE